MILYFVRFELALGGKSHAALLARKPDPIGGHNLNLRGLLRLLHLRGHELQNQRVSPGASLN